ncbi:MAG: hypothetical protein JSV84_11140 [Gemmatimonadota bacterium]|nr:MAG: hypothetical protein JSV84_11140 [Gemmatimonadota bacterium]
MAVGFLATVIVLGTTSGQESETPQKKDEPSVEKIAEGVYQIGAVVLDQNTNELSMKGEINMQRGLIEYFACTRFGKLHESTLVLDVEPYQLQVALLLMGLEPGGNIEYQGDANTPQGDSLEVWVEWQENGKPERHRAEDLVYNIAEKRTMEQTPWIFTGSKIVNGTFMADFEGCLIATFHDPFAILNNPLPSGADDTLYRVNESLVPEKGTPVNLILKAVNVRTED